MAQYKVIQDIEAEDKLVGPFSLRQFIYAGIAAFCGYLSVISVSKGVPFLLVAFVPPMLFCMFFAWPWSPDQPTEVWALARIRFYFKPRKRIWDQTGAKELVTITAPKKVERIYTDGLNQHEVKSRLHALADTIDSRGWVVKNSAVNLSSGNSYAGLTDNSDRLINYASLPHEVSDIQVMASDDILDDQNNQVAQQFGYMIDASTKAHRSELMERLRGDGASVPAPATPTTQDDSSYWFTGGQANPATTYQQPLTSDDIRGPQAATPTPAEEAYVQQQVAGQVRGRQASNAHLKTIDPAGAKPAPPPPPPQPVKTQADAAILSLASNNDLNVATLAREAHKAREPKQLADDEVVISLH